MLDTNEQQFLALVHLGLSPTAGIPEILHNPIEWDKIFDKAKKQTLIGILFDSITKLPVEQRPEKRLFLQWCATVAYIEKKNRLAEDIIEEVVSKYKSSGIDSVLLKGQGLAQYYPIPHHRQPGDIDLYFFDKYKKANEVASKWEGVNIKPETTYHTAFTYKSQEIENHQQYVDFYNKRNKERWNIIESKIPLTGKEVLTVKGVSVAIPQPQMNVLYTFLHIMHHLLQVGVGLRQLCDLTCLWRETHTSIDKKLFLWCIDTLKVRRAMTAITYIMQEYLGLEKEIVPLDTTSKQAIEDGEFILRDILNVGNFGMHTGIMQGFKRNKHIKNTKNYFLAFKRQMSLLKIYPSEVIAYPFEWLKSKITGR